MKLELCPGLFPSPVFTGILHPLLILFNFDQHVLGLCQIVQSVLNHIEFSFIEFRFVIFLRPYLAFIKLSLGVHLLKVVDNIDLTVSGYVCTEVHSLLQV